MAEEEKILSIKVDYAEAIKAIAEYQTKIDELKIAEKDLEKQWKDGEIKLGKYNEEMAASKLQTQQYKEAIRILNKEVNNSIKSDKKKDTSLKGLRATLSNLTAEYDSLSREERNTAKGKDLQEHINKITNEIKAAEEGTGRFYRNVGNYLNSLDGSFKGLAATIVQFGKDTKQSFDLATAGASGASKAMKILKVAIASTGIGLFVVVVGLLASAFQRTQSGMETFQRISAMIGTTIDVVLDRLAMLGNVVVKVFQGDFKGAADAARGAISGIGEEIKEEVKQADSLKKALIQIEKEEVQLSITRSKNRAEIERLKQIAEDTTRAEKERLAAARQAYAIEQADMQKQIDLQERRLANMLGEVEVTEKVRKVIDGLNKGTMKADEAISMLGLSSSTMADFQQFADEIVKLNELQENSLTRQIEQKNKINTLTGELSKLEEAVKTKSGLSDEDFKKAYEQQEQLMFSKLINANDIKESIKKINAEMVEDARATAWKEIAIQEEKANSMRNITDSLIELTDAIGENNKAAAVAAKVLALAQIAIDTGVAISKAVAASAGQPFWKFLAEVGPFIAAIVSNMASAIKTVKSAKFSTGGDVSGAGTETSDSIPAMLSNGESVMTAKATSMFAPILSAFNQAGGGVPIYGQQSGNQAMGEDMLAKSFAKGLANMPSPVVSVEEISTVTNRVKVIENINRI